MVATVVIVDSDVALYTDPFSGTEAEDTVLDDRNGIACCCGVQCDACCPNNFVHGCCYSLNDILSDEVVSYAWRGTRKNTTTGVVFVEIDVNQNGIAEISRNTHNNLCGVLVPVEIHVIERFSGGEIRRDETFDAEVRPSHDLNGQGGQGVGLLDETGGSPPNWLIWSEFGSQLTDYLSINTVTAPFRVSDSCNSVNQDIDIVLPGGWTQVTMVNSFTVQLRAQRCLNNCTVCPP